MARGQFHFPLPKFLWEDQLTMAHKTLVGTAGCPSTIFFHPPPSWACANFGLPSSELRKQVVFSKLFWIGLLLFAAQTILADRDTISRIDLSKPYSFTNSFKSTFFSTSFTPGPALGTQNTSMDKGPCLHRLTFQWERQTINKGQVNK